MSLPRNMDGNFPYPEDFARGIREALNDTELAQAVKNAADALVSAAEKAAKAGLIVDIEVQNIDVTEFTDRGRRGRFVVNVSISRAL